MEFLNKTGLATYLTPLNVIIYLILINLIGFVIMHIDKEKARFGKWRISEKALITIRNFRWFYWLYGWNACI